MGPEYLDNKIVTGCTTDTCSRVRFSSIITLDYLDGTTTIKCSRGTNNPFYFFRKCSMHEQELDTKYCKG